MSEVTVENETKNINFEEKIESAKKLLNQLIDPQITLSNSVEVYKNGIKELQEAQKMLDDAKLQFEELNK
ncbi:MAG: exodeoxyribonuclease VII small subunit [Candidatus Marinarcus sp.]|uniref:exodeoxyribonuclease VII small subunit n=1 Tax=Candidatus Marinarcus sp. TaxID=3100987 RepID=UPI003AFFA909